MCSFLNATNFCCFFVSTFKAISQAVTEIKSAFVIISNINDVFKCWQSKRGTKKITSQALLHETSLTSQQPNNYRIYFMMSCESHA